MNESKSHLESFNRRLWLAFVLALLVAAAALTPTAAAQEIENDQLTVVAWALNVRGGPGVSYPVVGMLLRGEQVDVMGYDAGSDWWQIVMPTGEIGWVSGGPEYVSTSGDVPGIAGTVTTRTDLENVPPVALQPAQPTETIVFQTASGGPIYAVAAGGDNLRYLTTGLDPILSPDGQTVAFTRWNTSQNGSLGSLWLINADGSGERMIHDNVRNPRTPVWSPDGSQIAIGMQHGGRLLPEETCGNQRPPRDAFNTSLGHDDDGKLEFCYTLPADPHWGLRQVDVASGAHEDLPNDIYAFSPAWDPANSWRLVYDGNQGLVSLDLDQGTSWQLTNDVNDRSPAFSPDGSKIAVSYWQHDHWEVHVLNADGSGRIRVTETPWTVLVEQDLRGETPRSWNNAAPTWSPDGTQLAFLSDRTGPWEIWTMNADGSNQTPLISSETLAGVELTYSGVNERILSWQ
ncbi:MAG: SH3 domain-containing protein [Anaerolineae bacterium]|nr:SH3 domain-containing protein [Anaerolineae bacterium]